MTDTPLRTKIGIGFVLLAAVAFVLPSFVPLQPQLVHDTSESVISNESQLTAEGYRIIAYEDLSERGQELYRAALQADGEYAVERGAGAPEFKYPTLAEINDAERERGEIRKGVVVIERPPNASLPPADEPVEELRERQREREQRNEERAAADDRRLPNASVVARYDAMTTRQLDPGYGATPTLLRLAAALLAVFSTCIGGYLLASN